MTSSKRRFGELQLAILDVLWEHDEATVQEIRAALAPGRKPAASTVATVLSRLEEQEVVAHRKEGRRYVYRAEVEQADVRRSMLDEIVERLFGGEPLELLGHLVREREIGEADLERLQALVEDAEG